MLSVTYNPLRMIVVILNVVVLSVLAPGQLLQKGENLTLAKLKFLVAAGSAKSSERKPKSCVGRVSTLS